jgi:BolA family transcriptional regulator, general stress-responsive regulator
MNINKLILIIKKKLTNKINIQNLEIEDKSFLHRNHKGNQIDKYHLKLMISSKELSKLNKINSNKKIYKILEHEMKKYIHSIQILIS